MKAFIRRFVMHYSIYRRYPVGPFKALETLGESQPRVTAACRVR